MKTLLKVTLLQICIIWIFNGCASVSPPTGGDKDIDPPSVISTVPINKSTNYNGQVIEMVFDEMITLENVKQELLITPSIEGNYEFETKKNRLTLSFDQKFNPNTTYTLNFRRSIKDVTEKNIAENTKLVFSTGSTIDSLYINGNVKDLLTNKPAENATVMLYQTDDTLNVQKHPPYYFTKTNKQGVFLLENIKEGTFNIYALIDYNNNLKYDLGKEKIAFQTEPLTLNTNIDSLLFRTTVIDNEIPKVVRIGTETEYSVVEFNEGLVDAKLVAGNQKVSYLIDKDKFIRIYNTFNVNDSIPIQVSVEDSAANVLQTEVKIKFNATNKKTKPQPFKVETNPKGLEKITSNLLYKINFNKPVMEYDLTKIELLADTITPIPLEEKDFSWNNSFTQLTFNKKVNSKQLTRITIPEATFYSVEKDTSDEITTTHELKDIEQYGTIKGVISTNEKSFIIQLLNNNYNVVAEQRNTKNYQFDYLEAGTYYVRVIVDSNENGRWDAGNFKENILPERVIFNKDEIPLKQNWEQTGQDISF